jgi:hypothetical protein
MKKVLLSFILLFVISTSFAQKLSYLKESSFQAGEELFYRLKYGILSAAEGVLKVENTNLLFNNKPTFHLVAHGKTAGAFSVFFTVNNRYDSYIDRETFLPYYYTENIREGKYRRSDKIYFDQEARTISGNKGNFKGAEQTFDLLSAYYFARNLDLSNVKIGDTFKLNYFLSDEVTSLGITYVGKERIKTPMGTFDCLKFNPEIAPGRIFRKDSKLYLWVTDDGNRIPVKANVEILVGSVTLELTDAKGLKYPLNKK